MMQRHLYVQRNALKINAERRNYRFCRVNKALGFALIPISNNQAPRRTCLCMKVLSWAIW